MRPDPRNLRRRFRLRTLSVRSLLILLFIQALCIAAWLLTWPQPAVELSFVVSREEIQPWEKVIAGFEAEHPDIKIELVREESGQPSDTASQADFTTNEREAIYIADFQTQSANYDLVYMDIIWTAQFQDNLMDLMPFIQQDSVDLSGFLDSELRAGEINKRQYRLPMRSDIGVLYYLNNSQNSAALPDDLASLAERIKQAQTSDRENQGYLWQGAPYEGLVANFMEVMSSFEGAFWIDDQTRTVGLSQPATLEAAKALRQLIQQAISPEAVTNYTEQASLEAFQRSTAAFLRGWPYFATQLKAIEREEGELAIAPPFSLSSLPAKGCRGGWGFGIPRNASHPNEAWEAIQYFTSESAQRIFVEAGYLPSRTTLFEDPELIQQYPQLPQLFSYLQQGSVFRPRLREYDAASAILQTALSAILQGQISVEQAMATAQRETEALLKS